MVVYSDTMISDPSASRQNIIPGALKSIVIHRYASIAFARNVSVAMAAIGGAKYALARDDNLACVITYLTQVSEQHKGLSNLLTSSSLPICPTQRCIA